MNAVNTNTTGINLKLRLKRNIFATVLIVVAVLSLTFVFLIGFKTNACADDVSSAQNEVDSAKEQLESIQSEYNSLSNQANQLQGEIKETTQKAFEAQSKLLEKQSSLNSLAVSEYKNGAALPFFDLLLSSKSLEDLVKNFDYCTRIMIAKTQAINEQKQAKSNFDNILSELNDKSDEMNGLLTSAANKKAEAEELLGSAQSKLEKEKANQLRSNPTPTPSPTPAPSPSDPGDEGGWSSGTASAYNSGTTATGAAVTESSMGVAVPMSLPGYRSLFGRTVMIKIGSTTVLGTINDCGGLDGGSRCMDVQPGIYHAFGYGSATAWGLRNVQYKIL